MIIIGLSDIHGSTSALNAVKDAINNADLTLLVGDITNFGRTKEAEQTVSPLLNGSTKVLGVSGNCDFPEVDDYLTEKNINLHGKGVAINGLGIIGVGGSLVTPFGTPNELTENEIQQALDKGLAQLPSPDMPIVLVSHHPPFKTLCDKIYSGDHVGSHAVRTFIETHQPLVCLTGHIHESVGTDHIGQTAIINPGQLRQGQYAWAEIDGDLKDCGIRRVG